MVIKTEMYYVQRLIDFVTQSKRKTVILSVPYWHVPTVLSWMNYIGINARATDQYETAVCIQILKP